MAAMSGSLLAQSQLSTGAVLPVVLFAAVLHAVWNAVAHGVSDRLIGFTLISAADFGCGGVLVLLAGAPSAAAWPYLIGSAVVHVLYNLLLLVSYRMGQFSQAYPLARGTSPWVVALVSMFVLDQRLPLTQVAGILVLSAGLISLVLVGGRPSVAQLPALGAAVATGLMIATYTVIDGVGVHQTSVLTYAGWLFLLQGPPIPVFAAIVRRRALPAQLRSALLPGLSGGVVSVAAYGLVLWAQSKGALAPIAALRETSILFGALIGAVFFGERLGKGRAIAAAVVVVGIVLVNL